MTATKSSTMPSTFIDRRFVVWNSVLVLASFVGFVHGIQWLSLSRITALGGTGIEIHSPSACEHLHQSLVKQQMKFCRDHPAFMMAVTDGAKWAIDECQFQFRTRRWNCSTINDRDIPLFRKKRRRKGLSKKERMQRTQATLYPNMSTTTIPPSSTPQQLAELKVTKEYFPKNDEEESENDVSPVAKPKRQIPVKYKRKKYLKKLKRARKRLERKKRKSKGVVGPYPVVPQGTREAAFVHAISSAGVAHAITRRCSAGNLDDCGCDRSVKGVTKNGFQWAGCSDNIAYGISLSKRFVDARDMHLVRRSKKLLSRGKRRSNRVAKALMNIHNNEAGRKLIENHMKIHCKCHGVSGSCELKTCWKAMPSFREIGELLKEKFDGATEVKAEVIGGRAELQPNQQYFKRPTETDLVYLAKSPEYCDKDLKQGSLGTHGRRCNRGSHSLDGCDLLCCGRGYTTHWQTVTERCACKFHWCCYVKCSTCTRNEEVHICN